MGFKWNLLHNLFHFDNGMQYIHIHIVLFKLYAGIGSQSPDKLSKIEKPLKNSSYQQLPAMDPENSEKKGWPGLPPI